MQACAVEQGVSLPAAWTAGNELESTFYTYDTRIPLQIDPVYADAVLGTSLLSGGEPGLSLEQV